ncbi:hypothetical protein BDV96DRAFT_687901 [Lophiotrema nucula]|uniref:Actin-like ATPase domain-containing protein n=1 Tax=Lophiotrema nucula TaxID=690887 RepID=A0A6A5Z4C2_9PLEO|nr:hypothetical protein BDV96DRAFT_687901 [Lophiotrema nucula]
MSAHLPHEVVRDIALGVDFGSHYTSVSFAFFAPGHKDSVLVTDIEEIRWPVRENYGDAKQLLTEIRYCRDQRKFLFGVDARTIQGKELPPDNRRYHLTPLKPLRGYPEQGRWAPRVQAVINRLTGEDLMKKDDDGIMLFFTYVFITVKEQLAAKDYTSQSKISMCICHPNAWETVDRKRFRANIAAAAQESDIGLDLELVPDCSTSLGLDRKALSSRRVEMRHVPLATEPEAAAIYLMSVLKDHELDYMRGAAIIIMDIGAGTVDISSYCLTNDYRPLLKERICVSSHSENGARKLEDRLRDMTKAKWKHEQYLVEELSMDNIDDIIEEFVIRKFESTKGQCNENYGYALSFRVPRLKPGTNNGCSSAGWLNISSEESRTLIFEPWYMDQDRLLEEQARLARAADPRTSLILTLGGGSDQSGLRPYLTENVLKRMNAESDIKMSLRGAAGGNIGGYLVSRGATLVALKGKQVRPEMIATSSIGILRHIPVGEGESLSIEQAQARLAPGRQLKVLPEVRTGNRYIHKKEVILENTIDWIVKKGQRYHPDQIFEAFVSIHNCMQRRWKGEEVITHSDRDGLEDGYPIDHVKNVGTTVEKLHTASLSFLRSRRSRRNKRYVEQLGRSSRASGARFLIRTVIEPVMNGMDLEFISYAVPYCRNEGKLSRNWKEDCIRLGKWSVDVAASFPIPMSSAFRDDSPQRNPLMVASNDIGAQPQPHGSSSRPSIVRDIDNELPHHTDGGSDLSDDDTTGESDGEIPYVQKSKTPTPPMTESPKRWTPLHQGARRPESHRGLHATGSSRNPADHTKGRYQGPKDTGSGANTQQRNHIPTPSLTPQRNLFATSTSRGDHIATPDNPGHPPTSNPIDDHSRQNLAGQEPSGKRRRDKIDEYAYSGTRLRSVGSRQSAALHRGDIQSGRTSRKQRERSGTWSTWPNQ